MVLKRLWDRWVAGKRTVDEVAQDFSRQLPAVKVILFRWFTFELERAGIDGPVPGDPDVEASAVFAGQIVNYLCGDAFDPLAEGVSDPVRQFTKELQGEVPDAADNLMRQDKNLRELVVTGLRIRMVLGPALDPNWTSRPGARQIDLLLRLYGGEFPDSPDERRYGALVTTLVAWSKSPQFPGANVGA